MNGIAYVGRMLIGMKGNFKVLTVHFYFVSCNLNFIMRKI